MRRASWPPSEQAAHARKQGRARPTRTTGLMRQRGKELTNDHARGAVEQAASDACHLAADGRLIGVAYSGAAVSGRMQGDASFTAAESERAIGRRSKRDRMGR